MWPDNETDRDFLNFTGVAETVAEIIVQAKGRPITIGVSGAWGVGKSSMIKLVHRAVEKRVKKDEQEFVFVTFNPWLYQGYDDARAALMDVIAAILTTEAEKRKKGLTKIREFAKRVKWFRWIKIGVGSLLALKTGVVLPGVAGEAITAGKGLLDGTVTAEDVENADKAVDGIKDTARRLVDPEKEKPSPPDEIHALRDSFEGTLEEMNVTLVILIDDLDRCLPETTISTLEAIRLFLFIKRTAFVIAADDAMIKHAVRKHFDGVTEDLVTNYFDKLIQLPIRVPPLGTQEVRAYMMLLFIENSRLDDIVRDNLRSKICKQLAQTWQGKRVDGAFVQTLHQPFDAELVGRFDLSDRLAPLMATASGIAGNPRLIKRFLNALSIRMAISRAQGVGVDEAVLAKMLLFERLGHPSAYAALAKAVAESSDGKAAFLAEWETKASAGQSIALKAPWDDDFVREWLTLAPPLGDQDLRGVLYVSREHAPLVTPQDRLSSEGADLMAALLGQPEMAATLKERLVKLPRAETMVIMDRLLSRARQEQEWGVPGILDASIVVAVADPTQGPRLAAFLSERPHPQIRANIVPKIADQPWAKDILDKWLASHDIGGPVRKAIKQWRDDGNLSVQ